MGPPTVRAQADAGFTLIEVMISTALFGLIALAGFGLLDSELRVRASTDGRLEHLGELQRAMYVMTADFEQMSGEDFRVDGNGVSFQRYAAHPGGSQVEVSYALQGKTLQRRLGGAASAQSLMDGVSGVHWRFYDPDKGWVDAWPASDEDAAPRPKAISIDLTLDGANGSEAGLLRRLVALPAKP
jgi:general secretion pathway protein J